MATGQLTFSPIRAYVATVGNQSYVIVNPGVDDSTITATSWYTYCLTNAKASMALGTPPLTRFEDAYNLCQTDLGTK
jgi:hypothetical protein